MIAAKAKKVIAVDFIKKFIEKNCELNEYMGNIEFVHGDATKLEYQNDQYFITFFKTSFPNCNIQIINNFYDYMILL